MVNKSEKDMDRWEKAWEKEHKEAFPGFSQVRFLNAEVWLPVASAINCGHF